MAFCQNCGSAVDGKFCAKCGAAAGSGPSPVPSSDFSAGPCASGLSDNVAGALAYIPILGLVFLLIEPYNRNRTVRFHAFQSLFLLAAAIVLNIVTSVLVEVLGGGLWFLYSLLRLAFAIAWLYLIVKTFSGAKIVLPIIGPLAEKQA
jgi:uncharacterized membrane protein